MLFAAKAPDALLLPVRTLIEMQAKPAESEFAGSQDGTQFGLKRARLRSRHFVLNGDVEARRRAVLRGKRAVKTLGNRRADGEQAGAADCQRSASAQVHQAIDPRGRRGKFSSQLA